MSKSLLKMLESLKSSASEAEKIKVSKEVIDFALLETEFSKKLIESYLLDLLKNESSTRTKNIINGNFFKSRVNVYFDDNGSLKMAFGLAFLQDLTNFDSRLENDMIFLIDKIVRTINLDFVVNDITVNTLQIRNGEPVSPELNF